MVVFHEALWVTVMSFASVSLRYVPFHRLCGRARGEAFRALWYWAFLLSIGGFLLVELWRFPDPAQRLPDSFRVSLPYYVNVPAHVAVWLSFLMTAYHLHQFRQCRRIAEEVVDFTFDVLLLPVSFGLLALHCIRILPDRNGKDLWGATATLDAAEMWESWALWSFQTLFMRYVEGSEDAQVQLYSHFKRLCLAGVQQYVVFNFACNVLEFIWREVDLYDPELCGRIWGHDTTCEQDFYKVQDYLVGALWYSCSIAIYSILGFEKAMSRSLHPIDPFWKFWGAKLIVTVAGIQRLGLFGLTKAGMIVEVFAWYVHAYLLCFETLFLSLLHFRAYPAHGYFKFGSSLERAPHRPVSPAVYGKLGTTVVADVELADAAEEAPSAQGTPCPEAAGAPAEGPALAGRPPPQVLSLRPHAIGRSTQGESDEGFRSQEE